jgi:uncharacterized linocin/CFP29 family protein
MTSEIMSAGGGLVLDDGRTVMRSAGGKWAGERLLRAMSEGRELSSAELRTLDTLRKDDWIFLDQELVKEAVIRLVGVADLKAAGLTQPVANSLGTTIFQYEKITDMEAATVSLDGITRTASDRQEFLLSGIPLPIVHKDFFLNLRTLNASRRRGEGLDATQVRTAGRLVAEQEEKMLFQGGKTFGGLTIYGYTTHPDRNTASFGTNGNWVQAAKTGENMLADVQTLIAAAEADRMNGPYWVYLPRNYSTVVGNDFKANSDKTIRQRLEELDGILAIRVADQLPSNNIVLVQATADVVKWIQGETLQTVQWDVDGGFQVNFKAWEIAVPLVRSDAQGRSGVVHMS